MTADTVTEQAPALTVCGRSRKELDLRFIRLSHLPYTLSFILSLWLADMQYSYFSVDIQLGTLDSGSMMQVSYAVFAVILIFLRPQRMAAFRSVSICLVAFGFLVWMMPLAPIVRLIAITLCWAGLGGCAACSAYAFAFVLQNAERFYAALLAALGQGVTLLIYHHNIKNVVVERIVPALLVAGIALCLMLYREEHLVTPFERPPVRPRGKMVVLCCVAAFFSITTFGELLLRTSYPGHYNWYALGIVCSAVVTVSLHLVFRRCVWHLWNLFIGASALSLLVITLAPPPFNQIGALVYGAFTGAGYTGVMYMGGGFVKKYGSLRVFRAALFASCGVAIPPMIASTIINDYYPQALETTTIVVSLLILFVFVLFMPLFYNDLFRHGWLDEYHEADMNAVCDCFARYNLSPRERSVCSLLLRGHTLRQISSILGLQYPTVNTYCTTLYRKLSINSRAELFVLFGQDDIADPPME